MKTMKNKLNCLELNPLIKIKLAVKCKTRAQQVYVAELVKSAIVKSLVHSFFTSWCNFSDWWDFVPLIIVEDFFPISMLSTLSGQ